MTKLFTKKNVTLFIVSLICSGPVFADQPATGPFSYISSASSSARNQDVSSPEVSCDKSGVWVSGDLLYWTVCEGGFACDYGSTAITKTFNGTKTVTVIDEESGDLDFEWDFGFRLGAGYKGSSCWDAAAYWTHFRSDGDSHNGANQADWKLKFDEADAVFGYKLQYCKVNHIKRVTLTPSLGVRYAQINQNFSSHVETSLPGATLGSTTQAITTKSNSERFWGVGPLLGFETDFCFGKGFGAYGNLAGTVLYGNFKIASDESTVFTAIINDCATSANNCAVIPGFNAGVGLSYEISFVQLKCGWDHHTYFDYNKIGSNGNLNLYGVNGSVTFIF